MRCQPEEVFSFLAPKSHTDRMVCFEFCCSGRRVLVLNAEGLNSSRSAILYQINSRKDLFGAACTNKRQFALRVAQSTGGKRHVSRKNDAAPQSFSGTCVIFVIVRCGDQQRPDMPTPSFIFFGYETDSKQLSDMRPRSISIAARRVCF